ncbi:MAG: hypothetical protein H0W67_07670 [Gemmatimonadales bacterium]|nr:hypothetical protein [Gemmatimonadales bacterium]
MSRRRKAAGFAAVGVAVASVLGYLRHRRKRAGRQSPGPAAWPQPVRNFVRMVRERGANVRDVRLEERLGSRVWVVEWDGGRSLTFPV